MTALLPALLIASGSVHGITVYEGDRPQRFGVTILDRLPRGLGPNLDLILARLTGDQIEHTGVIAGMSGSPVYRNGELIGAVGYRMGSFSREPIAGITPIDAMRAVLEGKGSTAQGSGSTQRLALPLVSAGLDATVANELGKLLDASGYPKVRPVMGGGSSGQATPDHLVNGGAIAVELARGDVDIFATGTVTWTDGKRFLAFGHPMFGEGEAELPVATAWISTTLPSPMNAFKISRLGKRVGTMTQDRLPAIAGQIGPLPRTIPLQLDVGGTPYKVELAWHRAVLPMIAKAIIANALKERSEFEAGGTLRLTGTIATDHGDLRLDEWAAHPTSTRLAGPLTGALAGYLNTLINNPIGSLRPRAMYLKIAEQRTIEVESLRDLRVLTPRVRAGEEVVVIVRLRRYQGGERQLRLSMKIPRATVPGPAQLHVCTGSLLDEADQLTGHGEPPRRIEAIVDWLNDRHSPNQLALLALRGGDARSFAEAGSLTSGRIEALAGPSLDSRSHSFQRLARGDLVINPGPVTGHLAVPIDILPGVQ